MEPREGVWGSSHGQRKKIVRLRQRVFENLYRSPSEEVHGGDTERGGGGEERPQEVQGEEENVWLRQGDGRNQLTNKREACAIR